MSKFFPTCGFKWIDPNKFDLNKYASNRADMKKNVSNPAGWGKKLTWAATKLFFCQKLQFHYFLR